MSTNRKIIFAENEFYHVFNCGVEKRTIFTSRYEFLRFIDLMNYYRFSNPPLRYSKYITLNIEERTQYLSALEKQPQVVEIVAFCLMNNHFHFLLKQIQENGISTFISQITNGYTKYFNTKHDRSGYLFQGTFKAVHVNSDEQLLHLSRYIHLNPVMSFLIKLEELVNYPWSSYPSYVDASNSRMVSSQLINGFFSNKNSYSKFVLDHVDYARQLKEIKDLLLE